MRPPLSAFLALVAVSVPLAAPASAQAPKKFEWYEDSTDLGFKIKRPDGWDLIPPNPGEKQMIAEFSPPFQYLINVGPDDVLYLYGWLVKFDRRPNAEGEATKPRYGDLLAWIKSKSKTGSSAWELIEEKPLKGLKVPATEYIFEGPNRNGPNRPLVRLYAATFKLSEDLDVALIFNGPPKKQWRKYELGFRKMAKSLRLVEVEAIEASAGPGAGSIRAKKRLELERYVAKTPGWRLYETSNYFIISNNDDREFIKELQERMEAIRKVFERQYPPDKARQAASRPTTPDRGDGPEDGPEDEPEDEPEEEPEGDTVARDENDEVEMRSVSVQADPLERSKTSVVRVTENANQYYDYGGPGGSAGYWASFHEELVLYDDKAVRGRDFTWLVMNHEAFHQYIFYFYGNLAPHSWYNEGTGDYYSGFEYKRKKFIEAKPGGRVSAIRQMIRDDRYAPLKDFVRWSQSEYYGGNDLGISGADCYAQGWSLIWFLRTGQKKRAPGWQRPWNGILDRYLETLAETGDLDAAVDEAFKDVNWEKFEASWMAYTK